MKMVVIISILGIDFPLSPTTTYNLHPDDRPITATTLDFVSIKPPPPPRRWYQKLRHLINDNSRKLHLGLVNVQSDEIQVDGSADLTEIAFEKVRGDTKWEDLFPEWVDEDGKCTTPNVVLDNKC